MENPIGVVFALVGPFAVLIVDPAVDDDLARQVVAEEEAVLLEELCPEPMLPLDTQAAALAVFLPGGVLGDTVKGQVEDSFEPLRRVLLLLGVGLFFAKAVDLPSQILDLI